VPTLSELGYRRAFDVHLASGLVPGRVVLSSRGSCRVATAAGEGCARPSGALRHSDETPVVGDWVGLDGEVLASVLPRACVLARRASGGPGVQVVAAHVDVVFVIEALGRALNARRLERALTLAYDAGASPVVVLTKADLCADVDDARRDAESAAPGVAVAAVHAAADAESARAALLPHLGFGRTGVLLGPSGAGKSTLVNALLGYERQRVSEVRERDGKGRHTTTERELVLLRDGAGLIVDTPGLRELGLVGGEDALARSFADVEELAGGCRFRDCRHGEEPGCAVRAACAEGALDAARVASRSKLAREIARAEALEEHPASYVERRRWRALGRRTRQD
jgi:ribosome biogenesis GTPase